MHPASPSNLKNHDEFQSRLDPLSSQRAQPAGLTNMNHYNNHHNHRRKSTPKMSKITPKSFFKQTLIILITILLLCLILNTFLLSPFPSSAFDSTLANPNPTPNPKLKLYMYELPRKFTYGVIRTYTNARVTGGNVVASASDDYNVSELKYPGNQHPAEWYLFSDLINNVNNVNSNSPVVRVFDPDQADVFYVPFFSSLSLVVKPIRAVNVNDNNGVSSLEYSDERMQEELVEWLDQQTYWKRNNGWDHVFIAQDPNALYKIIDRIRNAILLVSDFGRLRPDQASLVKDVILPYSHRINSFNGNVGLENRNSLLFFMGNRYRKEGGKIRDTLFQILENEENVVIKHGAQSRESRRAATQGMHTSKFCLHPAGDTPSACRLFDAIVSLCVPVIISDQIELPFEDIIDYKKIAVFVDTSSAVKPGFLINLLRNVSKQKLLEFQQELKKVKHYFEYEYPNGTVNEIWRQVSLKLPLVKLMINRDKRLVRKELLQPDCSCICSNLTGPVSTL